MKSSFPFACLHFLGTHSFLIVLFLGSLAPFVFRHSLSVLFCSYLFVSISRFHFFPLFFVTISRCNFLTPFLVVISRLYFESSFFVSIFRLHFASPFLVAIYRSHHVTISSSLCLPSLSSVAMTLSVFLYRSLGYFASLTFSIFVVPLSLSFLGTILQALSITAFFVFPIKCYPI